MAGGFVLRIRLRFHNHAPQQLAIRLAFHQQATDQIEGDDLGGAGEEALGEELGERGGYGSGLEDEVKHQYPPQSHFSVWFSLSPAPYHLR